MKQAKRDSKYILKRILIGVGVALILANLKKCNVYADETHNFYLYNQSSSLNPLFSTSLSPNSSVYHTFDLPFNSSYKLNMATESPWVNNNSPYFYFVLYNSNLDLYYYCIIYDVYNTYSDEGFDISNVNILFDNNNIYFQYFNTNIDEYQTISGITRSFIVADNEVNLSSYTSSSPISTSLNNEYYIYTTSSNLLTFDNNITLYSDFNMYYSNLSSFSINGVQQNITIYPGYEKVDITDYQAIYFVPKNYNNIQIETVDNINFIDFNYYFKGSIKQAYFSLDDTGNIVSTFQPRSSVDNIEYVDSILPLTENSNGTGYQYYSYLIYNLKTAPETFIYYNSVLFDYYLVDDMTDYQHEVCFIDRDDEETCINVIFSKSLEDIFNEGMQQTDDEFNENNTDSIKLFLDLIRLPFNFIERLKKTSCISLNLTIPYINYNLSLPCLSSIFKNYFKDNYSLIQVLISGILLYKVFLINFYAVLDVIKPQKSQVEVVDL